MIVNTDAIVNPGTMVVKAFDTAVANSAVLTARCS
jgi:hypothetical protein